MSATRRVALTALAMTAGWCVGWLVGAIGNLPASFDSSNYPFLARSYPPPHHVPKYEGGVAFRFAMAHDVIHERFAKHGPAYYRERDRLAREKLADLPADDPSAFDLTDDLGVGLDRLGRSDEAVAAMREKLARQEAKGLQGRDLYTSYANLGTFLIHGSFKQAAAGDASARERFGEGVGFIRKSVEVNPEAHFGREQWQAAIAEFLLATMDDPALLKTYDCLGNRLDLGTRQILDRENNWVETAYGRPYDVAFSKGESPSSPGSVRDQITKVGAETGWLGVPLPSHRAPVAFDEPTLGIIGMWRQGGGANPHFALALGETMLRVGQRSIAWTAFERAIRLADRYSTDPAIQEFLREHCRKRQAQIEETLTSDPARVARLLPQFEAELAYGQGYQKDYQEFEAAKIAAGASIEDDHFLDDFPRRNESIASRSGAEEAFARVDRKDMNTYIAADIQAKALLGAGLAAIATAVFLRWKSRRRAGKARTSAVA
ncbi:hypothetical protein [Planctomyces sp. SH-PL62]|uniref:hypothetical protein n=1 Tax=Planctomyces sp. SH-PL62 TaxID=1636152 RepID=UPI00078B3AAF|nr:hypothetical protein [Planctomyces sp. SH-PL62]AMV35843.1 hypothetical protein VT85_00265 [Planctomyces sp. SH-PL62]